MLHTGQGTRRNQECVFAYVHGLNDAAACAAGLYFPPWQHGVGLAAQHKYSERGLPVVCVLLEPCLAQHLGVVHQKGLVPVLFHFLNVIC